MDNAVHTSSRSWISPTIFGGQVDLDKLKVLSAPLSRENLEKEYDLSTHNGIPKDSGQSSSKDRFKPVRHETKIPSSSNSGKSLVDVTDTNDRVLQEIQALGDEFFGVVTKKKKKNEEEIHDSNDEAFDVVDDEAQEAKQNCYEKEWVKMNSLSDQELSDTSNSSSDYESDTSVDLDKVVHKQPEECREFQMNYALLTVGDDVIGLEQSPILAPIQDLITPKLAIEGSKENEPSDLGDGRTVNNVIQQNVIDPAGSSSNKTSVPAPTISIKTLVDQQLPSTSTSKNAQTDEKDMGNDKSKTGKSEDGGLFGSKMMEEFYQQFQKNFLIQAESARRKNPEFIRKQEVLRTLCGWDQKTFNVVADQCKINLDEKTLIPLADNPIAEGAKMPILAPPIPLHALKNSKALSIYVNFASKPGPFQWGCQSVNEQISLNLQGSAKLKLQTDITSRLKSGICPPSNLIDKSRDAIFTFVFYHQSGTSFAPRHSLSKEPELALKVNILGSQSLKELRQYFYCKNDLICGEIQGDDLPPCHFDKDACFTVRESYINQPCAIFMGRTLYTNESSKKERGWDYAGHLKDWEAEERKGDVGPFNIGNVEDTKIVDLNFQHGFPYVFIHHGNCEHLLVVEEVRLPNSKDSPVKSSYPEILTSNFQTVYCFVDHKRVGRYAVRNMDGLPQDPMILCRECLESYCYHQGKKVSNFKLFNFLQFSSIF